MQGIRKALTIVGAAAMALMLGIAAFAFSAAVEPALRTNPGAIMVGFAGTADAQPAGLGPIVTNVHPASPAKAAATPAHQTPGMPGPRAATPVRRPSPRTMKPMMTTQPSLKTMPRSHARVKPRIQPAPSTRARKRTPSASLVLT